MLGRRDEGEMVVPQGAKVKHSFWPNFWGISTEKSSRQGKRTPHHGQLWSGEGLGCLCRAVSPSSDSSTSPPVENKNFLMKSRVAAWGPGSARWVPQLSPAPAELGSGCHPSG